MIKDKQEIIEKIRDKKGIISDMDGVIYHGNKLLPGAKEFVEWLKNENKSYVFLTNASERTPRELQEKLSRLGIEVGHEHFYTSALATATFLASQKENGSAYIIGEAGIINALYDVGYSMNNINPDYVVIGDTHSYNYEKLVTASRLVRDGAKLIGTNPDITGPSEQGLIPATKALVAPIELATGKPAYYIGKPNPLMMRIALKKLGQQREDTLIIGDRMDTDIIAGIESEIDTCLVLSGCETEATIHNYPYSPDFVLNGVLDITA